MIQSNNLGVFLEVLFPGTADDDARFQAFEEFVSSRKLPPAIMDVCEERGVYTELDRFLQELRESDRRGTLDDYLNGIAPNNEVRVGQLLAILRAHHGTGLIRANEMTAEELRAFKAAHDEAARPNENSLPASSSDESSDDSEEFRRYD